MYIYFFKQMFLLGYSIFKPKSNGLMPHNESRRTAPLSQSQMLNGPLPKQKRNNRFANLHYIRAAILQATGIALTLDQTLWYLVDEGMISSSEARTIKFDNYRSLYATQSELAASSKADSIKPVDKVVAQPVFELVEEEEDA